MRPPTESSPAYEHAPCTLGRVQRYYALLCQIGLDKVFDREAAPPAITATGKPQTLGEAIPKPRPVTLDLGRLIRSIAADGLLVEAAQIVWLVTPEEAEEMPMSMLGEGLDFFAERSGGVMTTLLGTRLVTSPGQEAAPAETTQDETAPEEITAEA